MINVECRKGGPLVVWTVNCVCEQPNKHLEPFRARRARIGSKIKLRAGCCLTDWRKARPALLQKDMVEVRDECKP